MEELSCPRCKTTKYRNPSLKLMVNVCGHALCENCVELLFVRGSGACPQCNIPLRRTNFRVQIFEDAWVEKEVDIRKKILRDFNKKEDEFDSLNEYNNYLETVENIVFNLTNGIDVDETNKQIEKYRRDNQDQIKKNRSKMSSDQLYLEEIIEMEKEAMERMRQEVLQEQMQTKQEKLRSRQTLIEKLMHSSESAEEVVANHRRELKLQADIANEAASLPRQHKTQFSTGISIGKKEAFAPVPKMDEGNLYKYIPLKLDHCGPELPDYHDLDADGYLNHIRKASDADLGGGYLSQLGCYRALQDAFNGLIFTFDAANHSHLMSPELVLD